MLAQQLLLLGLLPLIQAQETVLGVFIFSRHGDRTAKAWTPVNLTDLGYTEVYQSGNYFRNRYLLNSSPSKIYGINQDMVKLSQLNVQAPVDNVLQSSAIGFLQGLYPPVGAMGVQTLADGSNSTAPLNGYQLIPVNVVSSVSGATNAESTTWLQGSSGCNNAIVSSNSYFSSQQYLTTLGATNSFYQNLQPVVNGSFSASYTTYKNAYSVFDLINVATIHNTTIQSSNLLTPDALFQLRTLADKHEFNLAYNESEPIRAIAGSTIAAQILQHLNDTISSKSATKMGIQFNAYASFSSFFGLSQLAAYSPNFTAVVDYASTLTFELVTNTTVTSSSYPAASDISVRVLFANGTAGSNSPKAVPLFGLGQTLLPYTTFTAEMGKFAIGNQASWCQACGNSTGVCATSVTSTAGSPSASAAVDTSNSGSGGMSLAVAGVIGAMVTLAVILGIEALILLLGGLRVVSRKRLNTVSGGTSGSPVKA